MEWQDRLLDFLQLLWVFILFGWAPERQARHKSPSFAPPKRGPGSFPEPRYPQENVFETEEDLARHVDLHTIRGNLPSGTTVNENKPWEGAEEPLEDGFHPGTPPPAPRRAPNNFLIPKALRRERPPGYDPWAVGAAVHRERLERNRMIEDAERKRLSAPRDGPKAPGKTTAGSSTINTPAGAQETATKPAKPTEDSGTTRTPAGAQEKTTKPATTTQDSGNNLTRPINITGSGQGEQQTAPKKNPNFAAGTKTQDGNLNPTDTALSGQGEQEAAPKKNPSFAAGNNIQDGKLEGSAKIESTKTTTGSGNNITHPTNTTGSGQGDQEDTPKKNISFAAGTKVEDGKLNSSATANENGSFKAQVGPQAPNITITDTGATPTGVLPTANNTTTGYTTNTAETQLLPKNPMLTASDDLVFQWLREAYDELYPLSVGELVGLFESEERPLNVYGDIVKCWAEWMHSQGVSDSEALQKLGTQNIKDIGPVLDRTGQALVQMRQKVQGPCKVLDEALANVSALYGVMCKLWDIIQTFELEEAQKEHKRRQAEEEREQKRFAAQQPAQQQPQQQAQQQVHQQFTHEFVQQFVQQSQQHAQGQPTQFELQMDIEQTAAAPSIARPQPFQQHGQHQQGQLDMNMEQTMAGPSAPEPQHAVNIQQTPAPAGPIFSQPQQKMAVEQQEATAQNSSFVIPTTSTFTFGSEQSGAQLHPQHQKLTVQSQQVPGHKPSFVIPTASAFTFGVTTTTQPFTPPSQANFNAAAAQFALQVESPPQTATIQPMIFDSSSGAPSASDSRRAFDLSIGPSNS